MISISYLFDRIKDVKLPDYMSAFPMFAALLLRPFYRKRYEDAWLICEEPAEARDNGYHFFKYMCEKQPKQKCFYAIKGGSVDAARVQKLGNTIEYGSIQHWLAYYICKYNISSQKGGKPNAAMCAFMEMAGMFKPDNIFLQHGVTINNVKWLYADVSRIGKFITATTDETRFIKDNFGYPEGTVVMTGFPRFDALHEKSIRPGQIVIMPTWRYWFNLKSKKNKNVDSNIATSVYAQKWVELLKDSRLIYLLDKHDLKIVFYLHRNMQSYIGHFETCSNDRIVIASWKDYDLQRLLIESEMLITDYSSVFFDMIYMKKPVLFYQFDKDDYRKYQYREGYFDYDNNIFGESTDTANILIDKIENIVENKFSVSGKYLDEHSRIFPLYDKHNSERVYKMLKGES